MVELTSWITADAEPVPIIKTLLVLVGTPADQLPPLLQRPVPAPLVNVSLVMTRGVALLAFTWPSASLDAGQSRATRTKPANKVRATFPQNGVVLIDSPLRIDRFIFKVTGKPEAVTPLKRRHSVSVERTAPNRSKVTVDQYSTYHLSMAGQTDRMRWVEGQNGVDV